MNDKQPSVTPNVRYFHEIMFSLNVAFAMMVGVFEIGPPSAVSALFRMEISIQTFLPLRRTDVHLGHWAFFLPAMVLALCIWISLRLCSHTRLTQELLRTVAGFASLTAPAACWLCISYIERRRYGWNPLHAIQTYELVVVLVFLSLYLAKKWPIPWWGSVLILSFHFTFWFWQFGPFSLLMGYPGLLGLEPFIGLNSTVAWVLYIRRLQREPRRVAALSSCL